MAKRPCRTCGQPINVSGLDLYKRVRRVVYLPNDYRCPSCGQRDERRRNADILMLWEGGLALVDVARRVGLRLKAVVDKLKEHERERLG